MDIKFAIAIHILVMISESDERLNSQALATSVGTNASYIRKIIGYLKKKEIVTAHQGKSGYQLNQRPEDISLLDIYYATQEVERVELFQIHQNSNEQCPVGQHIEGVLSPLFLEVENHLTTVLASQTLQNVIDRLYEEANKRKSK